jgi:3',5'-cyclic AMP phosphodiesterase CpdA
MPATLPAPVRVPPPAGMDPSMPFEPIIMGLDRRHDWLTAERIEIGAILEPIKDLRLWLLRTRNHATPDRADGTPGAPVPDEPGSQHFAVIGDFGEGSPEELRIAAKVKAMHPDRVLTLGDNVYPTGREQDWKRGFDPPELFGDMVKTTPFEPCLGNHDYYRFDLRPYFNRFPKLQGRPYYTWTSGDAQFFVLDTEQRLDGGSTQLAWLGAQLAQSKARVKIVYLHRPPYSSAGAEAVPAWRADLHRLLAANHVQLVLAGHEHSYERTHAIDGVTYIVSGGGGAKVYPFRAAQPSWSAFRTMRYNYLQLAIGASSIVVRAYDQLGQTFDSVSIPIAG